jgi:hypothetical protein
MSSSRDTHHATAQLHALPPGRVWGDACEQESATPIDCEDENGKWHREISHADDRPITRVEN